ncbi:MAG: hypothetical protein ACOYJY_01825 [Acutalibacteraceae bacterium]|jgi:hypothetical protein
MKTIKRFAAWLAIMALIGGAGAAAAQTEDIPVYELGRFSALERTYSDETRNLLYGNTLYADWKNADGTDREHGIDLQTDYPGRTGLRLKVTVDLVCTDGSVDPDTAWDGITVKLRSADVADKEGDPNLIVNGGGNETNSEHNYGWDLHPADVDMRDGHLELSIPLDRPCTNSRGLMDWTDVQRMIFTLRLKSDVVMDGAAPLMAMTLSRVMLVNDVMQITRDEITAIADAPFDPAIAYRADSVAAFERARENALATVADETAGLTRLRQARDDLRAVRDGMVETTYAAADFSRLNGVYPEDGMTTLLADWVYARGTVDGVGVDLSRHDRSALALQLELTLRAPAGYTGTLNQDGWALLRSADPDRVATFGVGLAADTAVGALTEGVNRLSLPLDGRNGYLWLASDPDASGRQGAFDWTAINRLQLYLEPENYTPGDFSLTVTAARIVDLTAVEEERAALEAVLPPQKAEQAYTAASWAAYETVRQSADALLALGDFASPETLTAARQALDDATDALEERPPFEPGKVNGGDAVTAADALLALQAATGKVVLSESQALAADVDGQNGVSASDALMILQYATGKIAAF